MEKETISKMEDKIDAEVAENKIASEGVEDKVKEIHELILKRTKQYKKSTSIGLAFGFSSVVLMCGTLFPAMYLPISLSAMTALLAVGSAAMVGMCISMLVVIVKRKGQRKKFHKNLKELADKHDMNKEEVIEIIKNAVISLPNIIDKTDKKANKIIINRTCKRILYELGVKNKEVIRSFLKPRVVDKIWNVPALNNTEAFDNFEKTASIKKPVDVEMPLSSEKSIEPEASVETLKKYVKKSVKSEMPDNSKKPSTAEKPVNAEKSVDAEAPVSGPTV